MLAATAKTLFVISITTARIFFPGMPQIDTPEGKALPNSNMAARTLRLDLTSPQKTDASARAQCTVPEG